MPIINIKLNACTALNGFVLFFSQDKIVILLYLLIGLLFKCNNNTK